jgi:twitching motility protein PilJ
MQVAALAPLGLKITALLGNARGILGRLRRPSNASTLQETGTTTGAASRDTSARSDGGPRPLPLVGGLSPSGQYQLLGGATLILAIAAGGLLWYSSERIAGLSRLGEQVAWMQSITQKSSRDLMRAMAGAGDAFSELQGEIPIIADGVGKLRLADAPGEVILPMQYSVAEMDPLYRTLVASRPAVVALSDGARALAGSVANIRAKLAMLRDVMPEPTQRRIVRLSDRVQRIANQGATMATSVSVSSRAAWEIDQDMRAFSEDLSALDDTPDHFGSATASDVHDLRRSIEADAQKAFQAFRAGLAQAAVIGDARNAAAAISANMDEVGSWLASLARDNQERLEAATPLRTVSGGLGIAAVVMAAMLVVAFVRATQVTAWQERTARRRSEKAKDESDDAIIRLMQEIQSLENGNLTVRATVTEHIVGSVADSVNAAVESLSQTITDVKSAVNSTTQSLGDIQSAVDEMLTATNKAAEQASASRNVSSRGKDTVTAAANRTEEVREQMQDISKRVKNLGEVIQQVGATTQLVENVAAQVEVLALNTALQAADAGEEGQRLRVIADEFRRLTDTTKKSLMRIQATVKSTLTETQSLIANIEQMTAGVVGSSQLWGEAREALENIEQSSHRIEEIAAGLTDLAGMQAERTAAAEKVVNALALSAGRFTTEVSEA